MAVHGAIEPVTVPTPVGPVAVHEFGAGRPTVLWHDVFVDGSSWGYLLPALLPGRRLVVVDGPGWGRSGRPARLLRDRDVVAAAVAVVDHRAPGEPVDWVGNGWGGRVGLGLAAQRPEAVRSIVLAGADPRPVPAPARRRLARTLAGLAVLGPVGPIGRAIVADRLSPASRSEPQTVGAVIDALLLAGRSHAARNVATLELLRPDRTALLAGLTVPALLVAGAEPWTLAEAEGLAALSPVARAVAIPGAGALLPLDAPGALADAIRAFWSSLDLPW